MVVRLHITPDPSIPRAGVYHSMSGTGALTFAGPTVENSPAHKLRSSWARPVSTEFEHKPLTLSLVLVNHNNTLEVFTRKSTTTALKILRYCKKVKLPWLYITDNKRTASVNRIRVHIHCTRYSQSAAKTRYRRLIGHVQRRETHSPSSV